MANRKVALPLENGILCAHFGHCETFCIVTVENEKIVDKKVIDPPAHEPGLYPAWIKQQGATEVICGGIGEKAKRLFASEGVKLYIGVPARDPEQLVNDLIGGNLQTGTNSCNHKEEKEGSCHHKQK